MKPLFFLSTEGGPLLITDVKVLREWRGNEEGDCDDRCREMTELKRPALELAGEHCNAFVREMRWGRLTLRVKSA